MQILTYTLTICSENIMADSGCCVFKAVLSTVSYSLRLLIRPLCVSCVCRYVNTCVHVETKVNYGYLSTDAIHLFFKTGFLTETWGSTIQRDCQVRKPQGSSCSYPPQIWEGECWVFKSDLIAYILLYQLSHLPQTVIKLLTDAYGLSPPWHTPPKAEL